MNIKVANDEYRQRNQLRKLSQETISQDTLVITLFTTWLEERGVASLSEVNKVHLREYIIRLNESKVKPVSINSYVNTITRFFKWCVKTQFLSKNPFEGIRRMEEDKPLPSYVPMKEMEKLFESFETSSTLSLTQIVMFEFFYATGIRTSELINIDTVDLDLKDCLVKIRSGKGNKERIQPFPASLVPVMKRYLQIREQQHFTSPYLFPNAHGQRMNRVDAYNYMKAILKDTSSRKKGAHTIRHSYATHLLSRGANIKAIAELLSHNSIKTTQRYAHLEPDAMLRIFQKSHPKA